MGEVHPLFASVSPARRFAGELGGLFPLLDTESKPTRTTPAELEADTGWAWRVLPRGAVVAMRRRHDLWGRRELRLARAEAPDSPEGWARWEKEVAVFLSSFGMAAMDGETPCEREGVDFYRVRNEPRDDGKAAARFQELRRGEVKPGRSICWDCREETGELVEVEWQPAAAARGQRCAHHAMEAGKRMLNRGAP